MLRRESPGRVVRTCEEPVTPSVTRRGVLNRRPLMARTRRVTMGAVTRPARRPEGDPGDADLVLRVRAGDRGAVDDLYDRFRRPAFALARRILADDTLAEDVGQDVLLTVWRDPPASHRPPRRRPARRGRRPGRVPHRVARPARLRPLPRQLLVLADGDGAPQGRRRRPSPGGAPPPALPRRGGPGAQRTDRRPRRRGRGVEPRGVRAGAAGARRAARRAARGAEPRRDRRRAPR